MMKVVCTKMVQKVKTKNCAVFGGKFFYGEGEVMKLLGLGGGPEITLPVAREYVLSVIFLLMYTVFVGQWVKVSKQFF